MTVQDLIPINVTAATKEVVIKRQCNRLWLVPVVLVDNSSGGKQLYIQPTDAVLAIRFSVTDEWLPWGVGDGMVNRFTGAVQEIRVMVVTPSSGASKVYLHTGLNLTLGYGNSSGLSPDVTGSTDAPIHTHHVIAPIGS